MPLPSTNRRSTGNRFPRTWTCFAATGALVLSACPLAFGQTPPEAGQIADRILQSNARDGGTWSEETGLELLGLDAAWYDSAKGSYFRYAKARVDAVLEAGANGEAALPTDPLFARQLLLLHRVTLDPRYYKAAVALRAQLAGACDQPSARSSRPICTAEPFLAEYASVFQEPEEFAKVTQEFGRWEHAAHWPSGSVPSSSTGIAFLAAALVDALPYYPQNDPGRPGLLATLHRLAGTAAQHEDKANGLFLASGRTPLPSSDACLLIYALGKGSRLGYLPVSDSVRARHDWEPILKDVGARVGAAQGPLLIAAAELDLAPTATLGRGKTVLLDAWFNSQQRKNAAGQQESFHYKWSDMSDSGYALLAHLFQSYGAATDTLYSEPTQAVLSKPEYYLIASPDIPVKNPNPHYMTEQDAGEIAAWVKNGGVLILLENDPPNADIAHLNLLADRFGLHFDDVLHHHILGEQVEDGRMPVDGNGPLFHQPHTFYMKDTCAIGLSGSAVALFRDRGDVVMASARYGRGTVFAAVDPWLYNEYTDGRKKPQIYDQFDNFAGGRELVQWLLQQHPH
jgi:unsaturated rhamnogalacturonyl hydrolase